MKQEGEKGSGSRFGHLYVSYCFRSGCCCSQLWEKSFRLCGNVLGNQKWLHLKSPSWWSAFGTKKEHCKKSWTSVLFEALFNTFAAWLCIYCLPSPLSPREFWVNLHLDHKVSYMSSLYLMWNALWGALKECCHLGKLIKGSASCSLHVKEYLQILLLCCFPVSLSTVTLCTGDLWRGHAMGGSFSCSSSEREGLPTVSISLLWLIQWLVDLLDLAESHDLINHQQCFLISLCVATNGLVSLPRMELNWKQACFFLFCCHAKG